VAAAGAELRFELSATSDVVLADTIQIQQVLVNLVQNSLQALASTASRERTLTIRTSNGGDVLQIDVVDNGPGFLSVDPEFAFAPFHSTKQDGLGIGLSICRSIVESHRGKIWTESPPAGGAQVSFTLPLAVEHVRRFRAQPDCLCC
jgi:two-component system sensor kinase FixL